MLRVIIQKIVSDLYIKVNGGFCLHLLFIAIVDFYAFAFGLLDTFRIVRVYIVFFHRRNDHSCARSDSVGVTEYLAVLFIYIWPQMIVAIVFTSHRREEASQRYCVIHHFV